MSYESFIKTIGPRACDEYANAMSHALWKLNLQDTKTTSQIFCRELINNGERDDAGRPVKIPYIVNGGLGLFAEWLSGWRFTDSRLRKMAAKTTPAGKRTYDDAYLAWLSRQKFTCDIDAMPEGELIFPQEPALRITGPFWQQQMVEGMALALISASSNITTIATQFWLAAQSLTRNAKLYEFGLRRAPSIGNIQGSRGAWIAGWDATSNCYAADCYDIPEVGTHAHAFVMVHETEIEAFANWAKAMPHAGVFLVDTYDTETGIRNAIDTCKKLGVKLRGVRLDSGDMTWLGRRTRALLNEAGFKDAIIMGSDSLAVRNVRALIQGNDDEVAPFDAFGIGGHLVGAIQNPLHSEVMKLAAVWEDDAIKRELMKFSNTEAKSTLPGITDVLRFSKMKLNANTLAGDVIVAAGEDFGEDTLSRDIWSIHPTNPGQEKKFPAGATFYRPIQPFMRKGQMMNPEYRAQDAPAIAKSARDLLRKRLGMLASDHKRLTMPHLYVAGIEESLHQKKSARVKANRRSFAKPAS